MSPAPTANESAIIIRQRYGKWDAAYLESRSAGKPFSVILREAGHPERSIRSAQRQVTRIRARLSSLLFDEGKWKAEKRTLFLGLRQECFGRLRSRRSKCIADDLKLLDQIDGMLKALDAAPKGKVVRNEPAAGSVGQRVPELPPGIVV